MEKKQTSDKKRINRGTYLLSLPSYYLIQQIGALAGFLVPIVIFGIVAHYIWQTVRRLHDFNLNGWWALLFGLPIVNLFLCFIPGTSGQNKFGPQPNKNPISIFLLTILLWALTFGTWYLSYTMVIKPAYERYIERSNA